MRNVGFYHHPSYGSNSYISRDVCPWRECSLSGSKALQKPGIPSLSIGMGTRVDTSWRKLCYIYDFSNYSGWRRPCTSIDQSGGIYNSYSMLLL